MKQVEACGIFNGIWDTGWSEQKHGEAGKKLKVEITEDRKRRKQGRQFGHRSGADKSEIQFDILGER